MRKYAKMLSLSLVLIMLCAALTACGGNQDNQTDNTTGTTNSGSTNGNAAADSTAPMDENTTTGVAADDSMTTPDAADTGAADNAVGNTADNNDNVNGGNETIMEDAGNTVGDVVDDMADGVSDVAQGAADVTDDIVGSNENR